MTAFDLIAVLITVSALFSYLNHRFLRFPTVIGLMAISMAASVGLVLLDALGLGFEDRVVEFLGKIRFDRTLLHGMLSYLLFAGALHVSLDDLLKEKWVIGLLAFGSVITSTFIVGGLTWWTLGWMGIPLPLSYCLLFGALISPTDPIAVMGILRSAGAPRSLETKITGESLFNDGVAVVLFIVLAEIAASHHAASGGGILRLFVLETGGGVLFGFLIGITGYYLMRSINEYVVEIMITLAMVTGGYALADAIGVSGPIAIVVAGLLIGNHGRLFAMSKNTREHLDTFWELIDEILNAVLFVLIGLELLVLTRTGSYVVAGILMIPIVLLARFVSVGTPLALLRNRIHLAPHAVKILTWGGIRGGISVALALSIPKGAERDVVLTMTYLVVAFSIMVQGLTIGKLVKRAL